MPVVYRHPKRILAWNQQPNHIGAEVRARMNKDDKIYETRKRLISRFVFSLEAELETGRRPEVYDDQFLIRMGTQAGKFSRSFDKSAGLMIIIDVAVLLMLSGHAAKLEILGNELGKYPGLVEIGLFLAALMYHFGAFRFVTMETYKEIIAAVLEKKNPDSRVEFFMGSLIPFEYAWEVLKPTRYGFRSGKWQIVLSLVHVILMLSIVLGLYLLHAIALYFGCSYVLEGGAFGSLSSKLIVGALLLINLSGLVVFLAAFVYPFKFQARLPES